MITYKKNYTSWLSGIYPRTQGQFNKQKSINAIHHISKRIKTHMTVSIDMEKALDNSQHSLMTKTLSKLVIKSLSPSLLSGLPWWFSGKESACQCRRHRFNPWSEKIPHAMEQFSPCATITEPGHRNWDHTLQLPELESPTVHARWWAAHALQWGAAPGLTATREKPAPQRRPNTAKNKKIKLYIIKVTSSI